MIDTIMGFGQRVGAIASKASTLQVPEAYAPVRDKYALALKKLHRFYLLSETYVSTRDDHYRNLANDERAEATRLRHEVWGELGDIEYWLLREPCPTPGLPPVWLEDGLSI